MPLDLEKFGSPIERREGGMGAGRRDVLRMQFARQALHEMVETSQPSDVTLSPVETRRLLGLCVELIDLCARVTGKIDPAVAAMVAYARDEAVAEAVSSHEL